MLGYDLKKSNYKSFTQRSLIDFLQKNKKIIEKSIKIFYCLHAIFISTFIKSYLFCY